MNFDRLRASVITELREEFKATEATIGSPCAFRCPSTRAYDMVHDPDVVAALHGEVLDELFQGKVMAAVSVRETKREFGRMRPKWDEHDWTRQDWRYERFVVECSAAPLWNLLERSVDFERLTKRAAAEVMKES